MERRAAKWWIVLGLGLLAVLAAARAPRAETLLIVAHRDTPVERLDREELARIFLLKRDRWPDGRPIVPVNREASSHARALFSRHVLGKSVRALNGYWNQMRYRGFMPPVVQESDQAVVAFVSHVAGAVGYVREGAVRLPAEVRVLARIDVGDDGTALHRDSAGMQWRGVRGR